MKKLLNRFRRALMAFRQDSLMDFTTNEIPNVDWDSLPDMPEAQKDALCNDVIRTSGKVLAVHMLMMKIPKFIHGSFMLDLPDGRVEEFRLRFTRITHSKPVTDDTPGRNSPEA